MRFADLFCGIGGFHYGLAPHGECVFACDIDERARLNYALNHRMVPLGDIGAVSPSDLREPDVLCAGFPCQPFSASSSRAAQRGLKDPRGNLFREIVRLAKGARPRVMLLENVPRLLSMDKGRTWSVIRDELTQCGYTLHTSVLNAGDYGVPQARRRLYVVCLRNGSGLSYEAPSPTNEQVSLADVMEDEADIPQETLERLIVRHPRLQIREGVDETRRNATIRIGEITKGTQGARVYSRNGHAVSQSSGGGGWGANTGLYQTVPGNAPREKAGSGQTVFSTAGQAITQLATDGGGQGGMYRVVPADAPREANQSGRVFSDQGQSPTITAHMHTKGERGNNASVRRGGYVRVLTVTEVRRVMGFPADWRYECTPRQAKSLLGNAVIPRMVSLVWRGIRGMGDAPS